MAYLVLNGTSTVQVLAIVAKANIELPRKYKNIALWIRPLPKNATGQLGIDPLGPPAKVGIAVQGKVV